MYQKEEVSIGLLNSISDYYISIWTGQWMYTSQGDAPTSIEYVDNTGYSSTGSKYDNFKITASKDYLYSSSRFRQTAGGTDHIGIST